METPQQTEAKRCQLTLLEQNLAIRTYPDYPERADRLVRDVQRLGRSATGRLIIPDGPWTINNHPNCTSPEAAPTLETQEELARLDLELDAVGRPLHPWFHDMISDPAIGVVTGKGFYHKWGPNRTADAVVIQNGSVLLVKRKITGLWALPGGHLNHGETPEHAARRETKEETEVIIPRRVKPTLVYEGPVVDIRATANAWPETTAYLYEVDDSYKLPAPHGKDDAIDAKWFNLDKITEDKILFGAHRYLLDRAIMVNHHHAQTVAII